MDELEFSHYESVVCEGGWLQLKAWYWSPNLQKYVWLWAD